jgi:exopolyphosphatase / guanosine-5'-triphosphate,3'-diphosphate pyrophosphatase
MRIAAIDIGSNSIHLLVVESDSQGSLRILAREQHLVCLARGIARSGKIHPEAFQTGLETLAWMAEMIRGCQCDTVMACGTAALRGASNAAHFIEESARLGIHIRVISGEEEARLIFLAVSHAIPFPEESSVLVDIGGGSTTMTWLKGGRVPASLALPWGPQLLADALTAADPPNPEDLKRVQKFIRRIFKNARKQLPEALPHPGLLLGTSGTLQELAKHAGSEAGFTREQLLRFKRKLWRTGTQGRIEQLGVDPKRADALHIGASWVLGILDWLEVSQVRCLAVGLREGMIWNALKHGGVADPAPPERRQASVEALAAKLDPDPCHSRHVGQLADQLFLDLKSPLELGDRERELLSYAARLHDIGISIAEKEHHKHGACLIQNENLSGFWRKEAEIIAQVVRFHRGKAPSQDRHEGYAQLAPWHRSIVEKLAAILRTADALDRGHKQAVRSVRVRLEPEEVLFQIQGTGELRPELESLQEKGLLLHRLLGRPVRTLVTEQR